MESIIQGWLTKSPPEKKQFKLFGSKWRKRYFVLYAPPTVDGIPDAYTALLEYYTSKKLHHKCGTINLADCQEVLSSLDSDIYKHVFGLQTMHKSQLRTYFLAAETEPEMCKWVSKLCQVLGLTENDDGMGSPPSQLPHRTQQSVRMSQPLKIPGSTKQPFTRPLTHQSPLCTSGIQSPAPPPPRPVPSMPSTPFNRLNLSESNLIDVTSPKSCVETRRETVDVGWQFSSPPGSSKMASPPGSSRMRNAESFPELDRFSPTTRKPGGAPGEGRELPPIPPEKTGPKVTEAEVDINYDLPKQKYYERYNSEDQMNSRNEGCYNSPQRGNGVPMNTENGGWYNQPQTCDKFTNLPKNLPADDDDCYNVPKSQLNKHASQGEEFYNIPKSHGSERPDLNQLPKKMKSDRRSCGGQEFLGKSEQIEDFGILLTDRHHVKSSLLYNFPQEDYDIPRSKDLSGVGGDVYNIPKHQDLPLVNSILERPKCFWETKPGHGDLNGKQPLDDQPQSSHASSPAFQPNAAGGVLSASLSATNLPPEKPPRPLSRPSPDRQNVAGAVINLVVEQSISTLDPGFRHSRLASEERQADDRGTSENFGSSELKKTPSNTFKQNKSSVQSSSSIHKRQMASNLPIHDSIRFTQRTKSFKRSIPSQDRSTLPLPVKRIVERSESSSSASSDDEGDHVVTVQGN